jgi:hypothetical protein
MVLTLTTLHPFVSSLSHCHADPLPRYTSTVIRHKKTSALVKFGDWPERFNEWIPFDSLRMAPLGTFTNGEMTNRMSQGPPHTASPPPTTAAAT